MAIAWDMEAQASRFNEGMKMRLWIGLLGLPILGACHQGTPTGNYASPGSETSFTAPTLPTTPLAAGQWDITATTGQAGAPGVPMAPTPGETPIKRSVCVTAAQAAEPSPELMMGSSDPDECHREAWTLERGRVNGVLLCAGNGVEVHSVPTHISGSYSNQVYSLQVESETSGQTLRRQIEGHRTGACAP
jgi:hypothetical protein